MQQNVLGKVAITLTIKVRLLSSSMLSFVLVLSIHFKYSLMDIPYKQTPGSIVSSIGAFNFVRYKEVSVTVKRGVAGCLSKKGVELAYPSLWPQQAFFLRSKHFSNDRSPLSLYYMVDSSKAVRQNATTSLHNIVAIKER